MKIFTNSEENGRNLDKNDNPTNNSNGKNVFVKCSEKDSCEGTQEWSKDCE